MFDDLGVLHEERGVDEGVIASPEPHECVDHGSPAALDVVAKSWCDDEFRAGVHGSLGVLESRDDHGVRSSGEARERLTAEVLGEAPPAFELIGERGS